MTMENYKEKANSARIIERSFDVAFGTLRQALIMDDPNISDHAIDMKLKAIFSNWQKHNDVAPEDIK